MMTKFRSLIRHFNLVTTCCVEDKLSYTINLLKEICDKHPAFLKHQNFTVEQRVLSGSSHPIYITIPLFFGHVCTSQSAYRMLRSTESLRVFASTGVLDTGIAESQISYF